MPAAHLPVEDDLSGAASARPTIARDGVSAAGRLFIGSTVASASARTDAPARGLDGRGRAGDGSPGSRRGGLYGR